MLGAIASQQFGCFAKAPFILQLPPSASQVLIELLEGEGEKRRRVLGAIGRSSRCGGEHQDVRECHRDPLRPMLLRMMRLNATLRVSSGCILGWSAMGRMRTICQRPGPVRLSSRRPHSGPSAIYRGRINSGPSAVGQTCQ
jgi:hypothetical protein